jgi:cardiolipin synthase
VGRDIVRRLARKAAEGVEVRLLLDHVGSLRTTRRFLRPLLRAGGQVAFFMPVLHRPFRGRSNLRNHRKIVVADGRHVMAGGTNIAGEYIGPKPDPERWRDLSFILTGPAGRQYEEVFRSDWEFAAGQRPESEPRPPAPAADVADGAVVQVVPSGPDVPSDALYDAILSTAFAAKRRLWVVTPYFIPDEPLVQALALACHRGVDVRVVLPNRSDHWLVDLARGPYLREIQARGAAILLYTPGMLHAKAMLMDDELAMIGSANMDMRSLFLNYEVAMFVYSAAEIRAIGAWIEGIMAGSRSGLKDVGAVRDLCEGVARMMAPLL